MSPAVAVGAFGTDRSSCSRSSARPGRFCRRPTPCRSPSGPSSPPWSIPRPPSSPIDRLVRRAAFVRNEFLGHRPEPPFATVGAACHESRRAELTRPVDVRTSERVSGHSVRPARGPRLGARSEWFGMMFGTMFGVVWVRAARGAFQRGIFRLAFRVTEVLARWCRGGLRGGWRPYPHSAGPNALTAQG
jgi:hypothetical protein